MSDIRIVCDVSCSSTKVAIPNSILVVQMVKIVLRLCIILVCLLFLIVWTELFNRRRLNQLKFIHDAFSQQLHVCAGMGSFHSNCKLWLQHAVPDSCLSIISYNCLNIVLVNLFLSILSQQRVFMPIL